MFELAMPWILLLLCIPPIIWFCLPRALLKLPAALKVPFYNVLFTLVDKDERALTYPSNVGLLTVIWVLMVLALAGPRWIGDPIPLAREGRNIMLVLDLSGSMEFNDMVLNGQAVSRLSVVKRAAKEFVRARAGDRIGLILFGTHAYLQTPLTFDRQTVLMRIDDASVGLAGKTTSIGDALGLAVKRLQDVPKKSRVVILLTDGANNSGVLLPLKAAELAHDEQIKVYTIGLGSESDPRAMNDSFLSFNPGIDLDEKTLQEMAKMTDGRYFRATDTQSLHAIYKTINQLEAVKEEKNMVRPQKEYYPWPLAFALIVFIYWFSKKAGVSFLQVKVREGFHD